MAQPDQESAEIVAHARALAASLGAAHSWQQLSAWPEAAAEEVWPERPELCRNINFEAVPAGSPVARWYLEW